MMDGLNMTSEKYGKYRSPSLEALGIALSIYSILLVILAFCNAMIPESAKRMLSLAGIAGAILIAVVTYFVALYLLKGTRRVSLPRNPVFPGLIPLAYKKKFDVFLTGCASWFAIALTRWNLRMEGDWNVWWALGSSLLYTVMITVTLY